MKAASHKIISYIMLCIALLPLAFAAYVQIAEAIIHHQMREELEQKIFVTIHIKSSEVIWTKKGKEASVNGDMFDVKNYKIVGDDIELTGLFDKDEDALFAQINNAVQKNNTDATGSTLVLKWFGCFSWNANQMNTKVLFSEKILPAQTPQNNFPQNPVLLCDTPPPKLEII